MAVSQKLQGVISDSWHYGIQNNFNFNNMCFDPEKVR